ncbi:MAG: hypothetical protein RIS91_228 [Bacteroidota bacterium]|jgi:hypothetical protein
MNISIATKPAIYKIFRNLPNTHWNCISEFIDNSLSAWLENPTSTTCIVNISIETNQITVEDNGPGISVANFQRAFEPANTPVNNTSLNEFGMGLKTASLYLGNTYKVQTQRQDSPQYEINFDLETVTEQNLTELEVKISERDCTKKSFTKITINNLNPETAPDPILDLEQIKHYLSKIYKKAISTFAKIIINFEELKEKNINFLYAPWHKDLNSNPIKWVIPVFFEHQGFKINGFIALLSELSDSEAGLLLFRRGRVVVGIKERFKPKILFSSPGSHLYKRLYGELELDGFNISMSKDQILEDSMLNKLLTTTREYLDSQELSLIEQGKEFRINKFNLQKNRATEIKQDATSIIPINKNNRNSFKQPEIPNSGNKVLILGGHKFQFIEGNHEGALIQSPINENTITMRSDFFKLDSRYKCTIELIRLLDENNTPIEILKKIELIWKILEQY